MPSKKRKYNARFPAGRIKKIMQTDEDVGKVAQAVPIIISRTLELFVESLLSKATQITMARNTRTLSPSHVKQCILAEARFDFLKDLVKNIPDVSAAEEKEMISAESSPNSSRYSDTSVRPRRIAREDSNSSSSCEIKPPIRNETREKLKRILSSDTDPPNKCAKAEPLPCTIISSEAVMDLSKDTVIDLSTKNDEEKQIIAPNFYQETLVTDDLQHRSVITVNPTYTCQPSTSSYANLTPVEPVHRIDIPVPKEPPMFYLNIGQNNQLPQVTLPSTPVTPIFNIDFTKNLAKPEIKVLDNTAAGIVAAPKNKTCQRQNSKSKVKKDPKPQCPTDIDHINSGNLQIDEDYDT